MKINFLIAIFLALSTFAFTPKTFKILVFSKTASFRHDNIEVGKKAFKKLAAEKNFQVEFTEDSRDFTPQNLKQYKTIVFLNTTGDVFTETEQKAFKNYINAGGGFVGIHAASDTEHEWPWFGELVGAYFKDHPKVQPAKLEVIKNKHWATKGMPNEFTHTDEYYNFYNLSDKVNHVLKLNTSSYEGSKHIDFHPMSWYHAYDGGRAFYTGLGHTKESFTDPMFLNHIWAGIEYTTGKYK